MVVALALASCGDGSTHHLGEISIEDVAITTAEGTPATVRFTVDDGSGSAAGAFSIAVTTPPAHGTFAGTSDPATWTYAPVAGFAGSDALAVTASAGAASASASVAITVTPAGTLVAVSDQVTTVENVALAIPAAALLANDSDGAGGTLAITDVGSAANGDVALAGDTITFTPAQDFVGSAAFAYTVTDGSASAMAAVTVVVTAAAVAPVAHDVSTAVSTEVRTIAFALDATPGSAADVLAYALMTPPMHGSASVTAAGSASYTTAAGSGQEPLADSFTYAVTDETGARSNTATVSIGVGEVCGNGFLETGEQCDDSNFVDADGCDECIHSCGGSTALADVVEPVTGSCYAIYPAAPGGTLFGDAATTCDQLGAHPPAISSAAENAAVQSLLGATTTAWLGGADEKGDPSFHWVTGEPFTFTKLPASPTLPAQFNCIAMAADGTWSLADCEAGTATAVICEFDLVRAQHSSAQANAPSAIAMAASPNEPTTEKIVTADSAASTVTVHIGDFGFGLGLTKTVPVIPAPAAVALGDLDDDGEDDVVAVSATNGSATVLSTFGQPPGSFTSLTVAFGTKASAVAIENFNGDSFRDLLVVDPAANAVLFRNQSNTGNGTFDPVISTPVGADPVALAFGHLDGDDILDAVTANKGANSVSVLIGNGDGTFTVTDTPVGPAPIGVAVGDFDFDNVTDIATLNSGDQSVTILLRGPHTTVTVPLASDAGAVGIAARGGDVVVATAGDRTLVDIAKQFDGSFAISSRVDAGGTPVGISTGPFFDDTGNLGVALASPRQVEVAPFFDEFGGAPPTFGSGGGDLITWGSFEPDTTFAHNDLVVGSTTSSDVSIYRAIDQQSSLPEIIDVGVIPSSLTGGRLTTDDGDDLIVSDSASHHVVVLPADVTTGEFLAPILLPTGGQPVATMLGIFNGGFRSDLAVLEQSPNQVEIFATDDDGNLSLAATLPTGAGPSAFAAGSLANLYGFCNDLVVTNATDNTASVFLCTASYTFTALPPIPAGTAPTGVAIAAFAGASGGLAIVNAAAATLTLYAGDGAGHFTRGTPIATGAAPSGPVIVDFDRDDHPDVLVAAAGALQLFRGVGDGTLRARKTLATGNPPTAITAAQANVDPRSIFFATAHAAELVQANREQF